MLSNRTDVPYKVQGFWYQLRQAEDRAGVEHQPYRAAHGFWKMVVGDGLDVTGNIVHALQFVGDSDMKQAATYAKKRADRLREHAVKLDRAKGTQKAPTSGRGLDAAKESAELGEKKRATGRN